MSPTETDIKPLPVFYTHSPKPPSSQWEGKECFHCLQVQRHRQGEKFYLNNGKGQQNLCEITKITGKDKCNIRIISTHTSPPPPHVDLYIVPPKSQERLGWMVEKLSEIGIRSISFLESHRSMRKQLNLDRLKRISIAALKQSRASYLPELFPIRNISSYLQTQSSPNVQFQNPTQELKYIANPSSAPLPFSQLKGKKASLLIGPEGGFTTKEFKEAQDKGFIGFSLGSEILRTETASILSAYLFKQILDS
ncbi:MAG: RsmE family RNA methyltransferase [Cytophagales bacterium]|nr:RsmE family RNA methyltransferase [Cytophagales bacterium]